MNAADPRPTPRPKATLLLVLTSDSLLVAVVVGMLAVRAGVRVDLDVKDLPTVVVERVEEPDATVYVAESTTTGSGEVEEATSVDVPDGKIELNSDSATPASD